MKVSRLIELLSTSEPGARVECTGVAFRTRTSGDDRRWAKDVVLLLAPVAFQAHATHR